MSAVDRSSLPDDVASAIRAVFGDAAIEGLEPLHGGKSGALVLSFNVDGAGYALRKGDVARAPREFACLRIASDRGVAPRVHHADVETGVCIMDRVAGSTLGRPALRDPRQIVRCAATLRRLHDGPAFPRCATLLEALHALQAQVVARSGAGLPEELVRTVEDLAPRLARYAETAPCHHDLNPNNMLETDERIFFVDWENAGAGDPFVDLAQLGVFTFPAREDRDALLEVYLARRPDDEEKARATLTRVVALAMYAAAFFYVRALSPAVTVASGAAAPLQLSELFRELALFRERTDPGVVGSSLLLAMEQESASEAFRSAKARLARS